MHVACGLPWLGPHADWAALLCLPLRLVSKGRAVCRAKNAAMGKRTRQVPEEVSKKLGQANLLYATERCARWVRAGKQTWEVALHITHE